MPSPRWTISIWMLESAVLAALLGACKLAPHYSFIAMILGMVWWLGAFMPHLSNWLGVILGSAALLPGAVIVSYSLDSLEFALGVTLVILNAVLIWGIFAFLPLIHRRMLRCLGSSW